MLREGWNQELGITGLAQLGWNTAMSYGPNQEQSPQCYPNFERSRVVYRVSCGPFTRFRVRQIPQPSQLSLGHPGCRTFKLIDIVPPFQKVRGSIHSISDRTQVIQFILRCGVERTERGEHCLVLATGNQGASRHNSENS